MLPGGLGAEPRLQVEITGAGISIEAVDVPLATILTTLGEAAPFEVRLPPEAGRVVTMTREDAPLEAVLDDLLQACSWMTFHHPGPVGTDEPGPVRQLWVLGEEGCMDSAPVDGDRAVVIEVAPAPRDELADRQRHLARVVNGFEDADEDELVAGLALDQPPSVRILSLMAMERLESRSSSEHLLQALDDANPSMRRTAIRAIGRTWGAAAVEPLGNVVLNDEDPEVVATAVGFLRLIGDDAALTALRTAASARDGDVKSVLERALRRIEAEDAQGR